MEMRKGEKETLENQRRFLSRVGPFGGAGAAASAEEALYKFVFSKKSTDEEKYLR